MCYRDCDRKSGYPEKSVLGVCYKKCKSKYKDHGASCYKNLFNWYFKSSFVTSQEDFFSNKARCPSSHGYHVGALCYKDCRDIGMRNCGFGACSLSSNACVGELLSMTFEAIEGVYNGGSFLGGMASKTAAGFFARGNAIVSRVPSSSMAGVRNAFLLLKDHLIEDDIRKLMYDAAVSKINSKMDSSKRALLSDDDVAAIAARAVDHYLFELDKAQSWTNGNYGTAAFHATGLAKIQKNCADPKTGNDWVHCLQAGSAFLRNFDPTGITGVAAAFLKPTCKV
eukprot:TRINITY_DN25398_c0_g1_i1.p1 TRINITY_DN25398_c0_g1~~TRINITY_DN25398_c0_g1_i1.p1  ORF type:complete len:282 (+),score=118.70 TRINITY_DN25398_c0_g1_i1:977-1822(+)